MKLSQLPPIMQSQAALALGIEPPPAPPIDERKFPKPAGRTNAKNDGRDFQKEVERTAGAYQSRRVATLRKVDPPMRLIWADDKENPGKKRTFPIFMENPHLDYVGVWQTKGGRALMIEAKSTSAHRLPFNGDSGLKRHQVANLQTWHAAGAAVALLWRFNESCRLWTPRMIEEAIAAGSKSLVFESGLQVPRGDGTLVWDFLPVLDAATPKTGAQNT